MRRFILEIVIFTLVSMLCFSVFADDWEDTQYVWDKDKGRMVEVPVDKKPSTNAKDKDKDKEPKFKMGSKRKKGKKEKTVEQRQAEKDRKDHQRLKRVEKKMRYARHRGRWGEYEYWYGTYQIVQSCMGHRYSVYNTNLYKPDVYRGEYKEEVEKKEEFKFPHPVH